MKITEMGTKTAAQNLGLSSKCSLFYLLMYIGAAIPGAQAVYRNCSVTSGLD